MLSMPVRSASSFRSQARPSLPDRRSRHASIHPRVSAARAPVWRRSAGRRRTKTTTSSPIVTSCSTNAFVHDELGGVHDPCYFLHFAEWAAECGLQYLAEADLGTMSVEGLDGAAHVLLQELSPDFLETQQLIDFIVNRSGRSSLLVRDDTSPVRSFSTESLKPLQFGTSWWNVTPLNAPPDAAARFESNGGRSFQVENPCVRWILMQLTSVPDRVMSHTTLETGAARDGHLSAEVGQALLSLVANGIVESRFIID